MKRIPKIVFIFAFALSLIPVNTFAAKPVASNPQPTEQIGYDVSYPQCGTKLPTGQYFGIVGVNGGKATTTNPCLASQLVWANKSVTGSKQPPIQLYVNTANPGEVINLISTWPDSNVDNAGNLTPNKYQNCTGDNDLACSWQYGWNRALDDVRDRFVPAAQTANIDATAGIYTWWLDVEVGNTWQSGSPEALARNVAALEGMTAYFEYKEAEVGIYSTAAQWKEITGNLINTDSNLNGLANWRPSGATLSIAKSNCGVPPLTSGGFISMTQYVTRGLDHNHSCI